MIRTCYLNFLFAFVFLYVNSHPQCLDYRPPFENEQPLKFCSNHSSYSCCTSLKDRDLLYNYNYVKSSFNSSVLQSCSPFLKELLCLECHPYAAHIYDAEEIYEGERFNKRSVNFPGLCYHKCITEYIKCRELFLKVGRGAEFKKFIANSTSHEFCSWAEIADKNYCFPNVKTINERVYEDIDGSGDITLCVKPLPHVFSNALVAVSANDGTHRLFVGEQTGLVYIVTHEGNKLEPPFLNISDRIINSGHAWDERGFLGLVFHPDYEKNGRFYIYYSSPNSMKERGNVSNYVWYWRTKHKIRISQFTVDRRNPHVADHSSELPLLEVDQPEANHNGGMLLFGSDGYLYVFIGDGGGAGDPHGDIGNGLKMNTLLGKVLRIDVDSNDKLYGIPEDNPFIGEENVPPEIYAYGIRNIWRCSLDKVTNQMFCGDVGQNKYEEINVIKKGGNYGWRAFEGFSCFDDNLCNQTIYSHNHVKPVIVYNHSIGQSVVGGYVYRGCDSPDLKGKYFYADTMNGRIFAAQKNSDCLLESREVKMGNNSICTGQLVGNYFRNILSFGESESGELFILASFYPKAGRPNSRVYQLVDPLKRGNPLKCKVAVKKAVPLKKIRNRNIYYKMKNIPIPKDYLDRNKRGQSV